MPFNRLIANVRLTVAVLAAGLLLSAIPAGAAVIALSCTNLNRNNTTNVSIDLAAGTADWGGTVPAQITPSTFDFTVGAGGSEPMVVHIDRSTGAMTEQIHAGGGIYVENWQCKKVSEGGF